MRSALRYLFLVSLAVVLAAVGSGVSAATMIGQTPGDTVTAVFPANGDRVGIAQPVTVTFAAPVADRAAAERSLRVAADSPLAGTVTWIGANQVRWTPTGVLPANAPITVQFGQLRTEFRTNQGVYAEGNLSTHRFVVSIGGQVVRDMPASFGKPGWETPSGTFPVLEKFRNVVFDSRTIGIPLNSPEGYIIDGEWAERLTWGGVFVHSAPWSVDSQGYANVSHGCVNLAPDDAAWFYDTVSIGDPVNLHW